MKKIISLALAASMVAGMAVTSFAAVTDSKTEPFIIGGKMYAWQDADTAKGIKSAFVEFKPEATEADYNSYYGFEVNPNGLSDAKMNNYAAYAKWTVGEKFIDGEPSLKIEKKETKAPEYDMINAGYKAGDTIVVDFKTTEPTTTVVKSPGTEIKFTMTLDAASYTDAADLATKRDVIINAITAVECPTDTTLNLVSMLSAKDKKALIAAATAAFDAKYPSTLKDAGEYAYTWFVTFNTIWSADYKGFKDVRGELTVAKRTTGGRDNFKLKASDPIRSTLVAEVNFNGIATDASDFFKLTGEVEDLEFDGCIFTVDTVGMSGTRIYKWNGTGFNKEIVAKFPNAVLSFFDFKDAKNPTFNRTGTLAFYTTDKNAKVYEILADGSLKLVESKYDEKMESVTIKTRTLGNYVVSDIELVEAPVVDAPVVDAPVDDVKPNPETGR